MLARNEIASQSGSVSVELVLADLSSLAAVRKLAADFNSRYSKLDVLINDAAVYMGTRTVTAEGFEMMFATNYLGPFLLTRLLIPLIFEARPSKIVNVTAPATTRPNLEDLQSERKFGALNAFGASKAAVLLFTYALAQRLEGRGITVNAYHPGVVKTGLMREAPAPVRLVSGVMNLLAGRSPDKAAEGLVQLAISEEFRATNGRLMHDGKSISAPLKDEKDLQERLWRASSALVGLPEVL